MTDPPHKHRVSAPYLPPPPDASEGPFESPDVPRMEPPPASLEALVRSRPGSTLRSERSSRKPLLLLLLVCVLTAGYFALAQR